jgi:hypothetical protein
MSDTPEPTERQKFESLAKRLIAVPNTAVNAAQEEWKKTKHKRVNETSINNAG